MDNKARITGKILVNGNLKNISPFAIGAGKGHLFDIEIVKDENGTPYIPASSFAGALRHYWQKIFNNSILNKGCNCNDDYYIKAQEYFWGSDDVQSHFAVSDLWLADDCKDGGDYVVGTRDGVAINPKTGVAIGGAKYNYEIVNKNISFGLKAEITLRESFEDKKEAILEILNIIVGGLKKGEVFLGAFTAKGFGRFRLEDVKVYEFKFPQDGVDYLKYLKYLFNPNYQGCCVCEYFDKFLLGLNVVKARTSESQNSGNQINNPNANFSILASFSLKSSLIIGSCSSEPDDPDKMHIKYDGNPVLTGTSLKGAIRARALRIVRTFDENGEEKLKSLFGWVDAERKSGKLKNKEKYKSRFIIEECVIDEKSVEEAVQTRVKIDRFTGGAMDGALFNSKPIWHKNEDVVLKIRINNAKDWEAGLILLVLKDLWNEDLPIGGEKNIGRGVLRGKEATIVYNGNKYTIKRNKNRISEASIFIEGDMAEMEGCVKKFLKEFSSEMEA